MYITKDEELRVLNNILSQIKICNYKKRNILFSNFTVKKGQKQTNKKARVLYL